MLTTKERNLYPKVLRITIKTVAGYTFVEALYLKQPNIHHSTSFECSPNTTITGHIIDIHSFIYGFDHYECEAPNIDINLQSGRFWAASTASFRERLNDSSSCWIVFIHVVRGRPGNLLQFSRGKLLRSSLHLFRLAVNWETARCSVVHKVNVQGVAYGNVWSLQSGMYCLTVKAMG